MLEVACHRCEHRGRHQFLGRDYQAGFSRVCDLKGWALSRGAMGITQPMRAKFFATAVALSLIAGTNAHASAQADFEHRWQSLTPNEKAAMATVCAWDPRL